MSTISNNVSFVGSIPEGVEENEASRFVDYTFATPWEVLVSEIEQAIKGYLGISNRLSTSSTSQAPNPTNAKSSSHSFSSSFPSPPPPPSSSSSGSSNQIVIDYNDYKYAISMEYPHESILLSTWFKLPSPGPYFIVSHKGEWRSDSDPSSRRTFFSAMVTALSSLYISHPILFVPATRMNIERANEILGYRIYKLPFHPLLPYVAVTHYESIKEDYYDRISSFKHALFYLDGVYEHFLSRISNYGKFLSSTSITYGNHSNSTTVEESVDKITTVEVIETYNCATNSVKFMSMIHYNESGFISYDKGWIVSMLHQQSQYLRQGLKYHQQALSKPISNSSGNNSNSNSITSTSITTTATTTSTKSRSRSSSNLHANNNANGSMLLSDENSEEEEDSYHYPTTSPLESKVPSIALEAIKMLEVGLAYRGTRQDFRVDNQNYTTMYPSKQPPAAWSCKVTFTYYSSTVKPITKAHNQLVRYGHDYSICLRNLLANYIISRCTVSGVSMTNLFSLKLNPKDIINKEKTKSISESLSQPTRDLIDDLITQIVNNYRLSHTSDNSLHTIDTLLSDNQHNKFLKFLFALNGSNINHSHHNSKDSNSREDYGIGNISRANSSNSMDCSLFRDRMASLNSTSDLIDDYAIKIYPFLDVPRFVDNINEDTIEVKNNHGSNNSNDRFMINNIEEPALGWTALLALYSSGLSDGIWSFSTLWNQCLRHLRSYWENSKPIPHILSYSPVSSSSSYYDLINFPEHSNDNSNGDSNRHRHSVTTIDCLHDILGSLPSNNILYTKQLWDDILLDFHKQSSSSSSWKDLTLPNMNLSLFNQKLQMLQFCTAMKQKPSTITISSLNAQSKNNSLSNDVGQQSKYQSLEVLRRLPLTEDAINQYFRLSSKISLHRKSNIDYSSSSSSIPIPSPISSPSPSHSYRIPAFSNESGTGTGTGPDELSIQQQFFHYQILAPTLVSDIRSYKSVYPASTPHDFCLFCGIDLDSKDVRQTQRKEQIESIGEFIDEVWKYCDSCPAIEQKPLLRVETEAEKCLTYFENISASKLLMELLIASLPALYAMISYDVSLVLVDMLPLCKIDEDLNHICQEIIDDLSSIYKDIDLSIQEIRLYSNLSSDELDGSLGINGVVNHTIPSSSNNNSSNNSNNSNNSNSNNSKGGFMGEYGLSGGGMSGEQASLILINAIERKLYQLEEFIVRYRALTILLTPPAVDPSGNPIAILFDSKDIKVLALRLWKHGNVVAKTQSEANILFVLAKNSIVPGSLANDLASSQGRELSPLKKTIIVHQSLVSPKNAILQRYDRSRSSGGDDMDTLNNMEEIGHRLAVEVTDDSIRASFTLIDFDN